MSTSSAGTLRVFTFKEGLLSKVAHDLQLTLERFEITRDGPAIQARFWPATLRVDGCIRDGRLDPAGLKDKDKREIQQNIISKVLHTDRYPLAELEALRTGDAVVGHLSLHGQRQPVRFSLTAAGGRLRGRITLQPSQFGVPPFKALLGAIKLQDRVEIEVDLPDTA